MLVFIKAFNEMRKRYIPKHLYSHSACHYDFQPRNNIVRSVMGYLLLLASILNVIMGFVYQGRYRDFQTAVDDIGSECTVPGAMIAHIYFGLVVIPPSMLAVFLYFVAFIFKIIPVLGFVLCPDYDLKRRKRSQGIPDNFDYLYDELHSDSDEDVKAGEIKS